MIRKLLMLAFVAMAAVAFSASAASAQGVEVHNPGMNEIESEVDIAVVADVFISETQEVHVPVLQCDNLWEANVAEDGHIDIHDVEILDHAGATDQCDTANDCDDAGWEGQLEEDGAGGFDAHLTFCLEGTDFPSVPLNVVCDIGVNGDEAHCDDEVVPASGTDPAIFVEGEVFFHEPLDLEHI